MNGTINETLINYSEGLSCKLIMKNFVCFFIGDHILFAHNYDTETNKSNLTYLNLDEYSSNKTIIKSSSTGGDENILVSWQIEGSNPYYSFYDFNKNIFIIAPTIFEDCIKKDILIEIFYFNIKVPKNTDTKHNLAREPTLPYEFINEFFFICKNENNKFNIYKIENYDSTNSKFEIEANQTICYNESENNLFLYEISNNIFFSIYFSCDMIMNNPLSDTILIASTTEIYNDKNISTSEFSSTIISEIADFTINSIILDSSNIESFQIVESEIKEQTIITDFTINSTIINSNSQTEIENIGETIIADLTINSTNIYSISEYSEEEVIENELEESIKNENEEIIIKSTSQTKEEILQNISNILKNKLNGNNYLLSGDEFNIVIKPTNSTLSPYSTHVDFSECESILRDHYKIPNSSYLTFFQLELNNNNSQSLINQLEYKVYDENLTELDLSLCSEVNIQIYYALKNDSSINISKISSFKDIGVDIFNINDSFFTDICTSYSESQNDLILEDRIKYIYQNYSLCEEGCTYNGIDLEYLTVSCECNIKNNLTIVVSDLNLDNMVDSSSGYDIIKCYNLVFSKKNKLKNVGFWLFTILLGIHIPLLIFYLRLGINPLLMFIFEEMIKYGYLKKPDPNDTKQINIEPSKKLYLKHNKKNPPKRNNENNIVKNNLILIIENHQKEK